MKKVVIAGASTYGVKNMGDDAMFKNLVDSLKREIKDLEIVFLSRHLDKNFDKIYGVRSIKNMDHDSKKESIDRFFLGLNPDDKTDNLANIFNEINNADLLILGGNLFMEVSENSAFRGVASYTALLCYTAKLCDTPFSIYGMSVLPYKLNYTIDLTRFVVTNAKVVTVREEYHKKNLIDIGIPVNNVKVLADPAFGLNAVKSIKQGSDLLNSQDIKYDKRYPLIGFNFRAMYYKWSEYDLIKYSKKMAKLADFLIKNINASILLIPNCTYSIDTKLEDDRYSHKVMSHYIKNKDRLYAINADWHMPQIYSIFPLLSMYISNRRHGCAFAAIHNIPFLSMSTGKGYIGNWHLKPFLESFGMCDQLVSITNDSIEHINNKAIFTWNNRDKLSITLKKEVPKVKRKARLYAKEIINAL